MPFIIAKKLNMTQVWGEDGKVVPVTALEAVGCKVSQIKTPEKDGYVAVQAALGKHKGEFRLPEVKVEVGQELKVSDFEIGSGVSIVGVSKGHGFTGAVKRHGFHGAPASHGHDHPRAVGSIGQRFPQHVRKGMRMAGRMGGNQATVTDSAVVAVDAEKNLLFVKGGVPGHYGSFVEVMTN